MLLRNLNTQAQTALGLIALFSTGCAGATGATTPVSYTVHVQASGDAATAKVIETLAVEGLKVDQEGTVPGVVQTSWMVDRSFDTGESWVYRYIVSIQQVSDSAAVTPAIDVRVCEPGQGVHLITGITDGTACNKARASKKRYQSKLADLSAKLKARIGTVEAPATEVEAPVAEVAPSTI